MFERKTTYTIPEGYREHIEKTAPTIKYRGSTSIHPEAYISDTCWIVGDVRIGYHAVVMHGACLRGDCDYIEIGAETNVQENCVLHESEGQPIIIGEHTTLGHGCVIHGVPGKLKRELNQEEVVNISESLSEGNLTEATRMYAEGLVFHPNEDLLRKIGAL